MRTATNKQIRKSTEKAGSSFMDSSFKIFLLFFGLALLLFGNSISNRYSLDDELVTLNHVQVAKGIKAIPEIFSSRYVTEENKSNYGYRPIVKVTFAVEHELFGQNPHVGHFINILLYALCVTVLFRFLKRLFGEQSLALCFWVSLLFLFHPIHNEVVVSLKNRDSLLSFLFGMMAMNASIDAALLKKWIYYLKGILFIVLAMLSKTDVITFFFLIPFTLYFFETTSTRNVWILVGSLIGIYLIGKLTVGSVLADDINKRDFIFIENPLFFTKGFLPRITAGFSTWFFYLEKLLIPYPLLSYYGYNMVEIVEWNVRTVLGVLTAGGVLMFLVLKWKKKDPLYYGLVFFCVSISMFLNIVKPAVGIVAERFVFLPSIGFCVIAVALLARLVKYDLFKQTGLFSSQKFSTSMIVLFVLFSVQGLARNKDWATHLTLYETDSGKAPNSAKLHALAGAALVKGVMDNDKDIKNKTEAISKSVYHYQQALMIYPDYVSSLNNLGMVYQSYLKKHAEAAELFKKATALDSVYTEAYSNLGSASLSLKDSTNAEINFKKAINLNPDFIKPYASLTNILIRRKKFDEGIKLNEAALAKTGHGSLYVNLGKLYINKGDSATGIIHFEKASELDPMNSVLSQYLYTYFLKRKQDEKAALYRLRYENSVISSRRQNR